MYSDRDLYENNPNDHHASVFEEAATLAEEEDISFEQALQMVRDNREMNRKKGQ